jgi:hypothetical protein
MGWIIRLIEEMKGIPPFEYESRTTPNDIGPKSSIKTRDNGIVVRTLDGKLLGRSMTWAWKSPRGNPVFNFVSEGRDFSNSDRVLIPATGFYEYASSSAFITAFRGYFGVHLLVILVRIRRISHCDDPFRPKLLTGEKHSSDNRPRCDTREMAGVTHDSDRQFRRSEPRVLGSLKWIGAKITAASPTASNMRQPSRRRGISRVVSGKAIGSAAAPPNLCAIPYLGCCWSCRQP